MKRRNDMRKTIVLATTMLLLMLVAFVVIAEAGTVQPNYLYGTVYVKSYPLMSQVTTTGTVGEGMCISPTIPIGKRMCTATWSGTAPTNIVFTYDASEDGVNYAADATVTMTASPTIFHVDKPGIVCDRVTYSSRSGGDATTSLSVSCTRGGY